MVLFVKRGEGSVSRAFGCSRRPSSSSPRVAGARRGLGFVAVGCREAAGIEGPDWPAQRLNVDACQSFTSSCPSMRGGGDHAKVRVAGDALGPGGGMRRPVG